MRVHLDADMRKVHKRLAEAHDDIYRDVRESLKMTPLTIHLSKADQDSLVQVLENPPVPNAQLVRLFRGEKPFPAPSVRHEYVCTNAIGSCDICGSEDEEDGSHTVGV
jgi:hypothetical protein